MGCRDSPLNVVLNGLQWSAKVPCFPPPPPTSPPSHITNISGPGVCSIKPIFEVAIGLFSMMTPGVYVIGPLCSKPDSRKLDASFDQTLLFFVVTPVNSDVPVPFVQPTLIAELEHICLWLRPQIISNSRSPILYDYFDVSKPKTRFLGKNRVDYAFQPRYQKKIVIEKLGLCMERLWVR